MHLKALEYLEFKVCKLLRNISEGLGGKNAKPRRRLLT